VFARTDVAAAVMNQVASFIVHLLSEVDRLATTESHAEHYPRPRILQRTALGEHLVRSPARKRIAFIRKSFGAHKKWM
jgi:hypothetical protein